MLPKRFRLPAKLIKRAYSKGQSFRQKGFFIKYYRNTGLGSRIAIIVPKKVDKRATVRNLIKRQLAEIFQKNLVEKNLKLDLVIVVSAKKEYKEYEGDITFWLKQLS